MLLGANDADHATEAIGLARCHGDWFAGCQSLQTALARCWRIMWRIETATRWKASIHAGLDSHRLRQDLG